MLREVTFRGFALTNLGWLKSPFRFQVLSPELQGKFVLLLKTLRRVRERREKRRREMIKEKMKKRKLKRKMRRNGRERVKYRGGRDGGGKGGRGRWWMKRKMESGGGGKGEEQRGRGEHKGSSLRIFLKRLFLC